MSDLVRPPHQARALQWSRLNHLQVGRYAEYYFKMQFTLFGFDVYSAEVDDRGIDFVIRLEPDRYWDVQVKSIRNSGYIFFRKTKFQIRPNLLAALALFRDGHEPDMFLIPAARWNKPDGIFVDRNYDGLKSAPEYGITLSPKTLPGLDGRG
ncbi:DUF4365 domain-containing protein [Rhodoplanes roseus]|uniref:DUF4365 domain-containing protein n=1 Tax=Rhodoplanes roseus TaxID=29409 RepID=A0A327L420_9BRAD|nr:DUF4365 domain-containing protein [Rhodoplanes roseus]RAI45321.1 hypothetical protein CH341_04395 [Rhodoplanes roseus]